MCSACKDKVEIKCKGPIGGKTPIELKLYLLFSNLEHMEQDKVVTQTYLALHLCTYQNQGKLLN
jgi:hypothetical protein